MSPKLSRTMIGAIAGLVVIIVAIAILSMPPEAPPVEGEASVVIETSEITDNNAIEFGIGNTGEVDVRVMKIIVTGSGIEGLGEPQDHTGWGVNVPVGERVYQTATLSQGQFESGQSYDLTVTLETDKGDFTEDIRTQASL